MAALDRLTDATRPAGPAAPAAEAARVSPQAAPAADPPGARLSRRAWLKVSVAAGGGLLIGFGAPPPAGAAEPAAAPKPPPQPGAFLQIRPDNTVEIQVNRLDFGQGALTALPMLLAEELDLDWAQVRASLAPAGEAYKDPNFGIQMTGGSTAVSHSWPHYRQIGAAARAMLVQAAAAQWGVAPAACRTEAGHVLSGARRASYASLSEAAARLPVPATVVLKRPADFRIIGQPKGRLDAAQTVRGEKVYGLDLRRPGMKTAVLQHPPTFGGRVARLDARAALKVPGVLAVFETDTDRGGRGVAVVATGFWAAQQGRQALQVEWRDGPSAGLSTEGLFARFEQAAESPPLTARAHDVAALKDAARVIDARFRFPYLAHAPMEPLNATLDLDALDQGRATVWAGSQFQTIDQGAVAQVLGLRPEQVSLHTLPAGGGFGRRAVPGSDYLREAAALAKAWKAQPGATPGPVKVVWSREDDIRGGYYRPMHLHRVQVGLDARGQPLAWDHAIVGQSLVKGTPFEGFLVKDGIDHTMTEGVVENLYGLPMRLRVAHPELPIPVLWWRSVGHTHTAFVMETLADELAQAAGQDPVAWRLARWKAAPDPARLARHGAALELAVRQSGYGRRTLPAGQAWGVAVHESFGSVVAYVAEVSVVEGRPKVHRVTAGVHANTIVNPLAARAQVEGALVYGLAMTLPGAAITLKDGRVEQSQFSDYPPPRMPDTPAIDVHFVPSEAPPTGLGEPGTPPIAPAIANAVAALTGRRLRELPFAPLV